MDEIDAVFDIDQSHPAIRGHFPGRPVVPAVLLLENVQRLVNEHTGASMRILKLRYAKFMAPVTPGAQVHLNAVFRDCGLIKFDLHSNGTAVATGAIEFKTINDTHEK